MRAMMRTTLVGFVAVYSVAGLTLVGCSDDTGGGPPPESEASVDSPSGNDVAQPDGRAGVDAADAAPVQDSSPVDVTADAGPDVVSQADASEAAVGDAADAARGDACCTEVDSSDAAADVHDAATDVHDAASDVHDAAVDVVDATTSDVADAKVGDADATVVDADAMTGDADAMVPDVYVCPTEMQTYPLRYAAAFCYGVGNCCAGFDAGGFDMAKCVSERQIVGWDDTIPNDPSIVCRAHTTIDVDASADCLSALAAYPCGTSVPAATFAALIHACQNVIKGTLPIDAGGCLSSFECVEGAYCTPPVGDSGVGTCMPLAGDGGVCTVDDMCRSATSGQPSLYCTADLLDTEAGTCAPQLPDTSSCTDQTGNTWDDKVCLSLQCGDDQTCGTPATLDYCSEYAPLDGGTD
jgi:hypothetical protein